MEKMVDDIASFILLKYGGNDNEIQFILEKMSPSLGFSFDFFCKENMARKQEVLHLQAENIMQVKDRAARPKDREITSGTVESAERSPEAHADVKLFRKYISQTNNIENVPIVLNASVLIKKDEL